MKKDTEEKVEEFAEEKGKKTKTNAKEAKTDSDKKDAEEKVEDVKENAKKEDEEAETKSKDNSDEVDEDKKNFVEKDEEDTEDVEDVEKEDGKEKKFQLVFEISHDDVRRCLYKAINEEESYSWIIEVFDNHFVYQKETYENDVYTTKFYDRQYVMAEEKVTIGDEVEVFSKFLTKEEFDKIDAERNRVKELETELTTLKEFKAEKETADKMEILETYSEKLSEEKFKEFSEGIANFEAKDLEKEIAYVLFKQEQATEAKNKAGGVAVYTAQSDETTGKYGDLDRLFKK